ncbi:DUF72 domain-containing protein [Streptosporangiaceae bacterium NEAU-GS5]|nr:DUF72 domain-containing protein [Streptosporangiaceae bacterium NEAU-GS5]
MLIGTSGWQYKDWRGRVYPAEVPQRQWLEWYGDHFPTVENNNAFYRLPTRDVFVRWRDSTPPGFVMAVKASRYLTHMKRLKDPEEPVRRLMRSADGLGAKLGPILLQLPPALPADAERLASCLRCFPDHVRVAVEPRHPSWWTSEVRAVLERHGAALCWTDRRGRPLTPLWHTTDWIYLRFHEGAAHPWPQYGDQALESWLQRIGEALNGEDRDGRQAYVYFNNDQGGAAIHDAVRFADLARADGWEVIRTRSPDDSIERS